MSTGKHSRVAAYCEEWDAGPLCGDPTTTGTVQMTSQCGYPLPCERHSAAGLAQAEVDRRVASTKAAAFDLLARREGARASIGDVQRHLEELERDAQVISRAVSEMQSDREIVLDTSQQIWAWVMVPSIGQPSPKRAAAFDDLTRRMEALADEWERDARGIPRTMSPVSEGVRAAMSGCARDLRAALKGES